MNEKSEIKKEKQQDTEDCISIDLEKITKFGQVIPKPANYLEIFKGKAIDTSMDFETDIFYGINAKFEPLVICQDKAFKLDWFDILAIAIKNSNFIQKTGQIPEEELSFGRNKKRQINKLHTESCLDELSINLDSNKGGNE